MSPSPPTSPQAVFHAHIYLRRQPHDRNAWNRLGSENLGFSIVNISCEFEKVCVVCSL